jgi:RNA polymerase sigma-54 factor
MAAGVSLGQQTKLRQDLVLTPQLQAALEMLAMTQVELEDRIAMEVQDNPMLAWVDPTPAAGRTGRIEGTDFSRRTDVPDYDPWERYGGPGDGPPAPESLDFQIRISPADAAVKALALELLPRLTPEGWLPESDGELAALTGATAAEVAEARGLLQELDPPGLGARDLCECLLLQLAEHDEAAGDLAARLLSEARDEVERGELAAAALKLAVEPADVAEAMALLRHLDPAPGAAFRHDTPASVAPEVEIVRADNGEWRVEPLNPWTRRIQRSEVMQRFEEDASQFSAAEQKFLRDKMREARWFLDTLKQRELTMLRVVEAMVRRQRAMLDEGPDAAGPLTLRDIAAEVDLHESTISRVTSQKYVRTPHGQWSLRVFFKQSVGGDHTQAAIQQRIKALIGAEPAGKPLSDQAIADLLVREGMDVARRTVAKYRTELGLGTAAERRRTV